MKPSRTGRVFQHYGFSSRAPGGAEVIIINEGNHLISIAEDDRRYRIGIEGGEVCIYSDEGDHIRLKRDKEIYIKSGNKLTAEIENEVDITTKVANVTASDHVTVTSPNVNVIAATKITCTTPEMEVTGSLRIGGGIWAGTGGAGDLHVNGDVYDRRRSMEADRGIYDQHGHPDPQGGNTSPPDHLQGG